MQIAAMMRQENMQVGDKFPPEREIASAMNVSRNTLREAIASLRLMGLLEVRRSSGIFVAKLPSEHDATGIQAVYAANVDTETSIDARIAIEPGAAVLAAKQATKKDWSLLHDLFGAIVKAVDDLDVDRYRLTDNRFHKAIAEATHNELLIKTLLPILDTARQPLWSMMKRDIYSPAVLQQGCAEHKSIYKALCRGKETEIFHAVRNHLEASKRRLIADLEQDA